MAGRKVGELSVFFSGNIKNFQAAVRSVKTQTKELVGGLKSSLSGVRGAFGAALSPLGLGVGGAGAAAFIGSAVKDYMEAEESAARLSQAFKATGYWSGFSAKQGQIMAEKWAEVSRFNPEQLMNAEAAMAKFENISGDTYKQAMQASMDLAAATGKDMSGAVAMVGRALNAPEKGFDALREAGIALTAEQKEQVESLVKANDLVAAQKILVDELNERFAGAAEASTKTPAGQVQMIRKEWQYFMEAVGKAVFNATDFADALGKVREYIAGMKVWAETSLPQWINTAKILGIELKYGFLKGWETGKVFFEVIIFSLISVVENFKKAFGWIKDNFKTLIKNFGTIWVEAWKGYIEYLTNRFKSVWKFIKDPSAKTFANMTAANSPLAKLEMVKKKIDKISDKLKIKPPDWIDMREGMKMITDDYRATIDELDAERDKSINSFVDNQIKNINNQKEDFKKSAITAEKVIATKKQEFLAVTTKQEFLAVTTKFAGAAERGSVEAYKVEFGNQITMQKKIAENTGEMADASGKMVSLLEDINDNLEGGEAFAF